MDGVYTRPPGAPGSERIPTWTDATTFEEGAGSALGRGGMGVVMRVRDHRLNRTVALKVLRPDRAVRPGLRARFIEEALKWLQLNTAVDAEQLNPSGLLNCFNGVLRIDWQGKKPVPVLEEHLKLSFLIYLNQLEWHRSSREE